MNRPHPTADDLRRARARFESEPKLAYCQTGRYRMRYYDWGTGPTVVKVHGLCDEPLTFCMLLAELVDRGFRVVAYDLPNGVDDGARLTQYRHDHYVDDLIALTDHLALTRADILGTSFGSTITLRALARNPERFRKAALQGGFARRPLQPYERWPATLARYWSWRMNQLPLRRRVMAPIDLPQFVNCPPEIHSFLVECSGKTPVRAAASRALTISLLDLRPQLPSIPHPVLMIGGDRDAVVHRWCEAEVENGVPNVRRVELTPCGHYPQYTMPVPYAEALATFFRGD
jgi:pimeloyl-ACP methyl ester carboxylesterase